MALLEDDSCVALDGTGALSSKTMPWASCLHQVQRHGSRTDDHQMVGAALLHPDVRAVIPLRPAPMVQHDGTAPNDGARNAATRFLGKLRQDHPHRTCMVTADSLRAHAPPIATLHAHGLHAILGVKAGEQASLFQQVQAAEHSGRVTSSARHDRAAGLGHWCRLVNDVPRNASHAAIRVNGSAYWAMGADRLQHVSWVTDLRVSQRHVSHLMRGGRARGKMAQETCHTLNNHGDNCAQHDGPGTQHLSVVCAVVRRLACVVDQTQQLCCALFRAVWTKMGSQRLVWERLRAVCSDDRLDAMRALFAARLYGVEKPRPLWSMDPSYTPWVSWPRLLPNPTSPSRPRLRMPR